MRMERTLKAEPVGRAHPMSMPPPSQIQVTVTPHSFEQTREPPPLPGPTKSSSLETHKPESEPQQASQRDRGPPLSAEKQM